MKYTLKALDRAIANATSYEEWSEAAQQHDKLSGANEWKAQDRSRLYDYELIRLRLSEIRSARRRNDIAKLVFHLHEGLHGNLGNISNPALYLYCRFGTKYLISEYLDEVCSALCYLKDVESAEFDFANKLAFFKQTGRSFGQSALMLSGGATLGLFHMGVLKVLWEQNLLPSVISGSSAGSIMAAVVGTHDDDELANMLEPENLYLNAYRYVGWRGFLRGKPVLDGDQLESCLEENILDMTFDEAWRKTGRLINITVSPYDRHQQARVLNARTSPNVLIRKASLASCAIPGVFPPVTLWAKNIDGVKVPYIPTRKWVDGSIKDDLPVERLARLYGVNHTIVSQTNPHVVPFVPRGQQTPSVPNTLRSHLSEELKRNLAFALGLVQNNIESNDVALLLDKAGSVLKQRYVGDINIIPPRNPGNVLRILKNPSIDDVREFIETGVRTTWPMVEMIRNTTAISRTFNTCINDLKAQEVRRLQRGSSLHAAS